MTNQDDIDNDPARLERGLQQAIARIAESAARPSLQPPPEPRAVVRAPGYYWVRSYLGSGDELRPQIWEWIQPDEDDVDQDGWWPGGCGCGCGRPIGEPDEVLSGPLTPPEVKLDEAIEDDACGTDDGYDAMTTEEAKT